MATTRKMKAKNYSGTEKAISVAQKGGMKWLPFISNFVLVKVCALIKSGVGTDKGFKKVHLTVLVKALMEQCTADVSSTHVYNHLRKWSVRWLIVSKLAPRS
jgi:hypothetical protein